MRLSLAVLASLAACTPPHAAPRDAAADAPRPMIDAAIDAPGFSMVGPYAPVIATKRRRSLPAAEPVPAILPTRAPVESRPAIHGAAIASVAVTDDGRAAVSVDRFGAVRLWPALDGSLEPVAVAASHPSQLAIARAAEHFVIAALDRAGSLELLTVRPTGASIARARIDEPRPFVSIAATLVGFVALTDDQRIAVFSPDGASRGHLVPEPGEHIAAIVHRGSVALALIRAGEAVHGRWITPDGWGGTTARLRIDPDHAALTPDGTRLAASHLDSPGISVVELATGKVVETIAGNGEAPGVVPLGFIDAHRLAIVDGQSVSFAAAGVISAALFGDDRDRVDVTAAGDNLAVVGRQENLVLATPAGAKILGYKLAIPTELRELEHGALITDGTSLVRVDDRFAERERYALPPETWDITPLDTHHALGFARGADAGDLVAIDLDDLDASTILVHDAYGTLVYQPATNLYAVATRTHVAIGRFDRRTSTFEDPIEIPIDEPGAQIALPPQGLLAVVKDAHARAQEIATTEITGLDFKKHAFVARPTRTTKLADGWGSGLARQGPRRAVRGALVAEVARGRIALRDGAMLRWEVPAHGIAEIAWSARGELVGLGHGLVHLDLATGAFTGPHCGWGFGLWDEQSRELSRFASGGETVCDVE